MKKIKDAPKKLLRHISEPRLDEIEHRERQSGHFTKGICFYKLFWIFFIGCFIGVIVEVLFCLATRHYYESRSGLVYGPFNPVYGFGAVAMTLALYPLRKKSGIAIMVGGTAVGAVTEYLCSFIQEALCGSVSWDYSEYPFNINGRICLLYSFFWGFLAVFWLKVLYPKLCLMLLKIPNKAGRAITWVLVVFMIANMFISAAAVSRWGDRLNDIPPSTEFDSLIDKHFDNSRMEKIYPNMRW